MSVLESEPEPCTWPTTVNELETAEQFVVLSFRHCVFSQSDKDYPLGKGALREHLKTLGNDDGEMALTYISQLVSCMRRGARRSFSLYAPCYPGLGVDEAWVICFLAACQSRQPNLARTLANWMIKPIAFDELMKPSIGFAQILYKNDVLLPLRFCMSATGPISTWATDGPVTIH